MLSCCNRETGYLVMPFFERLGIVSCCNGQIALKFYGSTKQGLIEGCGGAECYLGITLSCHFPSCHILNNVFFLYSCC